MSELTELNDFSRRAAADYQAGRYAQAAALYLQAAQSADAAGDGLTAAEMRNNCSVARLQAGDAAGALEVVEGTDAIFDAAGDVRRQAMALGNCASALDDLKETARAETRYLAAIDLFERCGEKEMRALLLKRLSALQMRSGRQVQAMASMQSALDGEAKLAPREKLLKGLLGKVFRMLGGG